MVADECNETYQDQMRGWTIPCAALSSPFRGGLSPVPQAADLARHAPDLAADLGLVRGDEPTVAHHEAAVDEDGVHVRRLDRVRQVRHDVVQRYQVVLVQLDDHHVGPLAGLERADEMIEAERPGPA